MLGVALLSVMLSVVMLSVVTLNVGAPAWLQREGEQERESKRTTKRRNNQMLDSEWD